jgi:hypothetical protein
MLRALLARLGKVENDARQALSRASSGDTLASHLEYAFVYRPGGVPGGTVYTTAASLKAAMLLVQGPKIVQVDDSIVSPAVLPAGTYAFDAVTFVGATLSTALHLDDGVHFTGSSITFEGIQVDSAATTPIVSTPGLYFLYLVNETNLVMSDGAPFTDGASGGTYIWSIFNSGVGDGTHAVGGSTVGSTIANIVFSTIAAHAFAGAGTLLSFDSSSTVTAPQGAGVVITPESNSAEVTYTAAVVANWSGTNPTSVKNALDRIAAKITPIP